MDNESVKRLITLSWVVLLFLSVFLLVKIYLCHYSVSNSYIRNVDYDKIIGRIISEGMTDKEKAIAVYNFVKDNYISIGSGEKVCVNEKIWYGSCYMAASAVMRLSNLTGLKSRMFSLTGHSISEIFYDGGWHLFDADARCYYTDGNLIAGLSDIEENPDLLLTCNNSLPGITNEDLKYIYATTGDNYLMTRIIENMGMVMYQNSTDTFYGTWLWG